MWIESKQEVAVGGGHRYQMPGRLDAGAKPATASNLRGCKAQHQQDKNSRIQDSKERILIDFGWLG